MGKLLVVEDDVTMRSLLRTIFELEGFKVCCQDAYAEEDIYRAIKEFSPDVLLLDVNLLNANGIEITRYVRKEFGENIGIVLSSGMPMRGESLEAGANDFIMKPFMPDELIEKVVALTQ